MFGVQNESSVGKMKVEWVNGVFCGQSKICSTKYRCNYRSKYQVRV